jgi:hypothetical protein
MPASSPCNVPLSAVLMAVIIIQRQRRHHQGRNPVHLIGDRAPNAPRLRMVWSAWLDSLTDMDFVRRYRMSKDCFSDLCGLLQPILDPKPPDRSEQRQRTPTELCLSLTLRIVLGGSYLDGTSQYISTGYLRALNCECVQWQIFMDCTRPR